MAKTSSPSDETNRPAPWVSHLAHWMDTAFRLPGTQIRFGLDTLIGIIPVAGDTLTAFIGALMIREAIRLGLGGRVIARMVWNLVLDWLVGLVPFVDLILDTSFKAHTKNAKLLHDHSDR